GGYPSFGFAENTDDLFVGKTLLHGDVLMWLMKTLLTSGCTNQRGAGQQHLINSGDSNTQNQKGGYWKAGCFYRTLNRILARSRRNKIHFPLLPSTLCQTLVFTPAFKPSPAKSSLDQGTIRQVTGLFEVWDRVASNYAQLCIICVITQTMRNSA
ncbi:TPA: hypothetical protein ACWK6B_004258, partial [Escherichia coli]